MYVCVCVCVCVCFVYPRKTTTLMSASFLYLLIPKIYGWSVRVSKDG